MVINTYTYTAFNGICRIIVHLYYYLLILTVKWIFSFHVTVAVYVQFLEILKVQMHDNDHFEFCKNSIRSEFIWKDLFRIQNTMFFCLICVVTDSKTWSKTSLYNSFLPNNLKRFDTLAEIFREVVIKSFAAHRHKWDISSCRYFCWFVSLSLGMR